MKQLILILLLLIINSCNCQNKNKITNSKQITKDTMMHLLDTNKYRDWENDNTYTPSQNDKYLKKLDDRVKILDFNDKIKIEESNINKAITNIYVYDKNSKYIQVEGQLFYTVEYGIWQYYDNEGKIIKRKDWDKPYKFSISDLVKKFKSEYNVDLENPKKVFGLNRFEEKKHLNIPIYEVGIYTDLVYKWNFYLVNANSGKTLYSIKIEEGDKKIPLQEYYKSLKL
jgi:hypothetical protein